MFEKFKDIKLGKFLKSEKLGNENENTSGMMDKLKNIKVNFEVIDKCYDYNFVDQITMICPLAFEEKQLLLETTSISKRSNLLKSIIDGYASEENISRVVKH